MISGINNEIKWNGINLIEQWAGYGRPHAIQQSKINSILLFLMGRMDWFACWRRMRQRESCPIGFVFGWVSGGTAARQPAKKKDERAAEATLHFFSNSWRNEKNWRKEDWRNDGMKGWASLLCFWVGYGRLQAARQQANNKDEQPTTTNSIKNNKPIVRRRLF